MTLTQSIITIAVVVLGTVITRALPFIIFPENKMPPKIIIYLGEVLPYAVTGLLVVYCLKSSFFTKFHALPELISVAVTIIIHKLIKNTLLSIFIGTVLYMILVQKVFI